MLTQKTAQGLVLIAWTLFGVLVFPASAEYQTSSGEARIVISCKGGPSLGRISSDIDGEMDYRIGFQAGVSASYHLSRRMAVELGIEYISRGGVETYNKDGAGNLEDTWELDYVGLPLCAKYTFPSRSLRPYLFVGPELSFLLKATMERKKPVTAEYVPNPRRYDETDHLNSVALGLRLGGGLMKNIGSVTVSTEIGYIHGFFDAFDDIHLKSHAIVLSLGISMPIGQK